MSRIPRMTIALILAAGLLATVPAASADPDCDGPYCCDRNPFEIVQRYLETGIGILIEAIERAREAPGKAKCSAYAAAFLCSDESFPPQVSLTRTNPSNTHGHYSPCYEVFAPGVPNPFGCKHGEVYEHVFWRNGYHNDRCVPAQNMVLPSDPGS